MKYKDYIIKNVFMIEPTKKISLPGKSYIMDKDIISEDGITPYIAAISKNNGITGYSKYKANNKGDCITLSTTADSSNTVFYQENDFIGRQQIAAIRRKDGQKMGSFVGLYLVSIFRKLTNQFNYSNKLTIEYLLNTIISLPVKTVYKPDFVLMSELSGGGIDMRNIDISSWKEFKVEDILEKVECKKLPYKKSELPIKPKNGYIPARTATTQNHGLSCYVPKEDATVLKNVISVSANGDFCAFWHEDEFTILQDSYALKGKDFDLTEDIALFLISCMNKVFSVKYNWNNKSGWEKIKHDVISLPIKESEEIDWDYMQEYITELEQERITELEQYLIATGLNDYELTDEDKDILVTKLTDEEGLQSSASVNGCLKEVRKFRVGDLFESSNGDTDLQKININGKGYNVVSSGLENNGIIGKTDVTAKIFDADTITIDMFGNCFYRDDNYKMVTHARVFSLSPLFEGLNSVNGQYIVSQFKYLSAVYNYSNMCSWKKIKNDMLSLPIQTDDNNNPIIDSECKYHHDGYIPDWDFMERYIRAIEKIVIADVVKYKDAVIEKTREIIA